MNLEINSLDFNNYEDLIEIERIINSDITPESKYNRLTRFSGIPLRKVFGDIFPNKSITIGEREFFIKKFPGRRIEKKSLIKIYLDIPIYTDNIDLKFATWTELFIKAVKERKIPIFNKNNEKIHQKSFSILKKNDFIHSIENNVDIFDLRDNIDYILDQSPSIPNLKQYYKIKHSDKSKLDNDTSTVQLAIGINPPIETKCKKDIIISSRIKGHLINDNEESNSAYKYLGIHPPPSSIRELLTMNENNEIREYNSRVKKEQEYLSKNCDLIPLKYKLVEYDKFGNIVSIKKERYSNISIYKKIFYLAKRKNINLPTNLNSESKTYKLLEALKIIEG